MVKELILMEDVDGLGVSGEVVKVADGYARNNLIPNGKATPVTALARKQLEKKIAEREARLASEREKAEAALAILESASCTIPVKTGQDGKLFGSVQVTDILKALKGQGVELDKSQVKLKEPVKQLGAFEVPIRLHPDVSTVIKVWVVEE